jgi:signal transduction histidine kinase
MDKVERILEELLANAITHTPPDTPIWVRTRAPAFCESVSFVT